MVRAFRTLTLLLTVAAAAACSTKNTTAPPLTGPSELALSITMAATPDTITQDGASQSQVIVVARDPSGKAITNLPVRLEIKVGGQIVDYGTLSSKNVVTGGDGRASAIYTAPMAPVVSVDTGTIVTVLATPVGNNYANSGSHSVDIRLVPPGVIIPPSDLMAGFTFTPEGPGELETVIFTATPCSGTSTVNCTSGSVASYSWNFGDGGSATGQTVSHQFQPGTFAVTLTIKDAAGRAASTTRTLAVKIGTNPSASFVTSPAAPLPGQTVFFNAAASTAVGLRTIVDYQWAFGDGATGRGVISSHAFAAVGTYTVMLVVTDDAGRTGTVSQSVSVGTTGPGAPVAKFTYSPTTPTVGAVTFFSGGDSTSSSSIEDYVWDFGDGVGGVHGINANHVFATAGSYVVRLTITDSAGRTATTSQTVTVTGVTSTPPTANFTFSPTSPAPNTTVFFNSAGSTASPGRRLVGWSWNFGDGMQGAGGTPSHSYTAAGAYIVVLSVTDDAGATGTKSQTVTVTGVTSTPPTAIFTMSPSPADVNQQVTFDASKSTVAAGLTIVSYEWNFGDSTPIVMTTSRTFSHAYAKAGSYTINLTVTDSVGVRGVTSAGLSVNGEPPPPPPPPPVPVFVTTNFSWTPLEIKVGDTVTFDGTSSKSTAGSIPPAGFQWVFGDTQAIENGGPTHTHTYTAPGSYTVTLIVTDSAGNTGTISKVVSVVR